MDSGDMFKVALASSDLENVDTHFGRCRAFIIAEVDGENASFRILERRQVAPPCPSCGTLGAPDDAVASVVESLTDCRYVVVSRIGRWPDSLLYERGIESVVYSGPITDILNSLSSPRCSAAAGQ
jgi:predicted Fe-Mo cluster-binding NifX family protein